MRAWSATARLILHYDINSIRLLDYSSSTGLGDWITITDGLALEIHVEPNGRNIRK